VVFSYTDDWCRRPAGGGLGDGLTTRERQRKDSSARCRRCTAALISRPRDSRRFRWWWRATRARTLGLPDSLDRLNYPDYEVILVDDGSTDDTAQIAVSSDVRYLPHPRTSGCRSRAIRALWSRREIVAFTDSDCRPDGLAALLIGDLLTTICGIGGHNFLPPDDSSVAAACWCRRAVRRMSC